MSTLLLALLFTNPAYFEGQVQRARRDLGVAERVRVVAHPTPLLIRVPGEREPQRRVAYAQAEGREWLVGYDEGWLAKVYDGEAQWVAFHEVCHVALQAGDLRKGFGHPPPADQRKAVTKLEREASRCADLWVEELARRVPGRSAVRTANLGGGR